MNSNVALRVASMLKTVLFKCLVMGTVLLCVSSSGCRDERKVERASSSTELSPTDQPPDSESMSALRNTVADVVQSLRNGQQQNLYELLAPEIRRAVPFFEFLQRFGVDRNHAFHLPESLPNPDFSRVRDRVAEVFIMQPRDSTRTAVHLDLLRVDERWFLRTIVVYDRPFHAFHYAGGLISPGITQQDLIRIKEVMLQKPLVTGKDWGDADGFPDVGLLKPSIPVFVETDLDLRTNSQIHVPGWTIQVVPETAAIARKDRIMFFKFGSIQIFGDLVLGELKLGHPDIKEGGGRAQMWLVRSGNFWRFYKYGEREIS